MGRIHRWGMLVAFLVIIGCAYLGVKMVFVEDKDVAVPGVTGMQLVDALNALQTRGLLAKVDKVDSSAPAATVGAVSRAEERPPPLGSLMPNFAMYPQSA